MSRPRAAAALLAVVLAGTACSSPDLLDGRGRPLAVTTSGTTTVAPAPAVSTSTTASASASASGSATPSGSASATSTPLVSPGLALLRQLRTVSTASWKDITDPRTGTRFSLPAVESARTKLQNGISERVYEHKPSKQLTISVGYIRTASAAAAQALIGIYPTQLSNSVRALGADDAEISERRIASVDGRPSIAFRLSFTPTTIPQIPPAWLVTAVADGADIVLAQTIIFPPSTQYDYLRLARVAQQRLVQSLRFPG